VPDGANNDSRPITYATAEAPRVFLATGADDRTVAPRQATRLAA
jgi:hypothetical protein